MENETKVNWNYLGVFLSPESKRELLVKVGKFIPEGWTTYCHHMTLAYNSGQEYPERVFNYYRAALGSDVKLKVKKIGKSDKALVVSIAWGGFACNKITHITIAVAPDGKPVESNDITEWEEIEPFTLKGKVGYFSKEDKKIHYEDLDN